MVLPAASALLMAALVGATSASCIASSPDGVLQCYSDAHANRDIESLEDLLAEDYLQVFVVRPRAHVVNRDSRLQSLRSLFARPGLKSAILTFADGYRVVAGDEPDTWCIENLTPDRRTHEIQGMTQMSFHEVPSCVTLYVRLAPPPEGGYVIYREVSFYGDCGDR